MGKTSITLAQIAFLKKRHMLDRSLIVAPLRPCYQVWPKELKKWQDFNHLKLQILHGPHKEEALKTDADIYVINPEGLEWLLQAEKTKSPSGRVKVSMDMRRWRRLEFDNIVYDELSKFKHTNTTRFKTIKQVIGTFKRRTGLTGSPAANGLMGLFGQCFVLDEGATLGPYITHYRSKYFVMSHNGFDWDLRAGADKEIFQAVKPLMLRMAAKDYLKLPKLIPNTISVELPDKAREIYDHLEGDLIARVGNGLVVAANAAAASIKCRQVANGGVYLDPEIKALTKGVKADRKWVNLHTAKVDALAELIEELQGEPILVAYDFEHDLDRIRRRLDYDIPYIGGGVSPKRAVELENLWNAGKLPVLFGHPQSIAHGLNLQEMGHHVGWHSLTWDYELYDQFIKRVLRQGNKAKNVFVHHFVARNTVDEAMLLDMGHKGRGQQALFDYLKYKRKL